MINNNVVTTQAGIHRIATEPQGKNSIGKEAARVFVSIITRLKATVPLISIIPSQRQENALPVKQVNDFKMNKLQVCIDLLEQSSVKDAPKVIALRRELQKHLNSEQEINKHLLNNSENQEIKADSAYFLSAKSLVPDVVNKLAASLKESRPELSSKQAKKEIKAQFKQCDINKLNNADWNTVTRQFSSEGQTFTSVSTPAAQMKSGELNIFETDYEGKGVCSADQKNISHAANLWASEFSVTGADGKSTLLFAGVRHGVNSPYLLAKDSNERRTGAENRAKEVVVAALFLGINKDTLENALNGQTVPLHLTSTSLLAPQDILGSKEGSQLADQMAAWQALSSQNPLELSVPGKNGIFTTVKINLDVAAFNFPVNERGLKLGFGMKTSDSYNQAGLLKLLGDLSPKAEPGGWVGNYLKDNPENSQKVKVLANQLKTMLADRSYRIDAGDAYKAARVMALLSSEIGVTPAWNCKSGKDRTGMLDAEIKREAVVMHQAENKLPGRPGPLDTKGSELLQQVLLHSGNLEIQRQNTGAEGNKVLGMHWLRDFLGLGLSTRQKRIVSQQVADQARGLSGLV